MEIDRDKFYEELEHILDGRMHCEKCKNWDWNDIDELLEERKTLINTHKDKNRDSINRIFKTSHNKHTNVGGEK